MKQVKSAFRRSIIRHESALSGFELLARNFEFRVGQQRRNLNLELLLLTRNYKDFGQIDGLTIENWADK